LKDGKEITDVVIEHGLDSLLKIDIPWSLETTFVDYFDEFFKYFFPLLEGNAAVLDGSLSNRNCLGHQAYWVHEQVQFH
jgi:hypothetical protein